MSGRRRRVRCEYGGPHRAELLAFPHGRHDDQVDSIAQALAWLDQRKRGLGTVPIVPPVIVRLRNPHREAFPDYRDLE